MNNKQIQELKQLLDINLDENKIALFEKFEVIFLKKNAHTNLISRNDEKYLFEKHIFDSIAINKVINKYKLEITDKTILDIGTGGGFPAIPISIMYEELKIYPVDSIRKKIKIIEEIKFELNLNNIFPICDRVENLNEKFDFVTTRAVSTLDTVVKYAAAKLKKDGYFIAYKSKKATEELKEAQKSIKSQGLKMIDIIEYSLPTEEKHERNLIIFQKK